MTQRHTNGTRRPQHCADPFDAYDDSHLPPMTPYLRGVRDRPTQAELDLVLAVVNRITLDYGRIEIARRFYAALFRAAPGVRKLFKPDLRVQEEALIKSILESVEQAAKDVDAEEVRLERLGNNHRTVYHAEPEHYPVVSRCLLEALGSFGRQLTSTETSAIITVYEWMAAAMLRGTDYAGPAMRKRVLAVYAAPSSSRTW